MNPISATGKNRKFPRTKSLIFNYNVCKIHFPNDRKLEKKGKKICPTYVPIQTRINQFPLHEKTGNFLQESN